VPVLGSDGLGRPSADRGGQPTGSPLGDLLRRASGGGGRPLDQAADSDPQVQDIVAIGTAQEGYGLGGRIEVALTDQGFSRSEKGCPCRAQIRTTMVDRGRKPQFNEQFRAAGLEQTEPNDFIEEIRRNIDNDRSTVNY
jgi:hypothetical protein